MSHTLERLITMSNQISRAFARLPAEQAAAETAAHLKNFWEKRMLSQIFAHLDAGGAGLDETTKQALTSLRVTNP